jgi:SAM-dependent methyltransferase
MLESEAGGGGADAERAVRERYSAGALAREGALCCPVSYDSRLLEAIPAEVVERDYGCGDPSRHVREGETVLDLGSGTGKVCFIAAQVVGPGGRVIGVDMNDEMLALARESAPVVAERIGHANVEFRKARIQDLRLDRDRLAAWLAEHPVSDEASLRALEDEAARLRREEPLVATESVDVVVSNCVLNLVRPEDKAGLFSELHRVLKPGGRAVIADIVSDEDVPLHLQADPALWSGCVSGAFREDAFLEAFEAAGFHGIEILERQEEPWQVVEGIEFRSLTVQAFKGEDGPGLDRGHAVIYRGPFSAVRDDDGHVLHRGRRMAVSEKSFRRFTQSPYRDHVDLVEPRSPVPLDQAPPFTCDGEGLLRSPRETKGESYSETRAGAEGCCGSSPEGGSGCC